MSLELIKKYGIWAKKSLGQNFLIDDEKIQAIADTIEVSGKNIVEVWPWYGALTEKLMPKKPQTLTLVELDRDMIDVLQDRFLSSHPNPLPEGEGTRPMILNQDILQYAPDFDEYCVIANIPYYITSPILRHFLYDVVKKPEHMVILMQQDVGDKILWKGKNKSGVLSLFIEKKCDVVEVLFVSKECFHPIPKVESSVLQFDLHDRYDAIDDETFLRIIKIWFSSPRKKLIKNFEHGWLDKQKILQIFGELWIDEVVRWEDLDISKWCELVGKID